MSHPRPTRIGVIGCGEIAQIMHLPHLRELDDRFHLVSACDTDAEVLRSVALKFSIERTHPDAARLLDDEDIEAVVIATSGDHADLVLQSLDAGKHVFVE